MVAGFDDGVDIFVGFGFLFGQASAGAAADEDAGLFEAFAKRLTAGVAGGLVAALHPAGAVSGGKERRVISSSR